MRTAIMSSRRSAVSQRLKRNETLLAALDAAMLVDTPSAMWKNNETSGTSLVDSSGNAKHGTIQGGVTFVNDLVMGQCIELDGVARANAFVDYTKNAVWEANTKTVEVWVKPAADARQGSLFNDYAGLDRGFWAMNLQMNAAGDIIYPQWYWYQQNSSSLWRYAWVPAFGAGVAGWHQIVGKTNAAGDMILLVDGVEVARNSIAATGTRAFSNVSSKMGLGAYNDGGSPFKGRISRMAHYSTELSDARILAHRLIMGSRLPFIQHNFVGTNGTVIATPDETGRAMVVTGSPTIQGNMARVAASQQIDWNVTPLTDNWKLTLSGMNASGSNAMDVGVKYGAGAYYFYIHCTSWDGQIQLRRVNPGNDNPVIAGGGWTVTTQHVVELTLVDWLFTLKVDGNTIGTYSVPSGDRASFSGKTFGLWNGGGGVSNDFDYIKLEAI